MAIKELRGVWRYALAVGACFTHVLIGAPAPAQQNAAQQNSAPPIVAPALTGPTAQDAAPQIGTPPSLNQAPPLSGAPADQADAPPTLDAPGTTPPTLEPIAPDVPDFSGEFDFQESEFAAGRESYSAFPTVMGDFLGGGLTGFNGQIRVTTEFTLPGSILSGGPGQANSILGFDVPPLGPVDDIFTTGTGTDASGDGNADTFAILEPLPTSDAPTAPGAGFIFDTATAQAVFVGNSGGTTAVDGIYTNDDNWFVSYAYVADIGGNGTLIPLPGPGVSTRRVKIAENYSPEVRNRFIFNFNFFNDVVGNLGDIQRYTFGTERIIWEDLASIEIRLPFAGTYSSIQAADGRRERDTEFGNITLLLKAILFSGEDFMVTGGVGVTTPTASDARLTLGNQDLLVVRNESVHLLPFLGFFNRIGRNTAIQTLLQIDTELSGDPIYGDLVNRPTTLPRIGTFNDSTLLAASVSASHSVYEARRRSGRQSCLQQILLNGELHYTGTLQESDFVSANGITYSNLSNNFNVLNTTLGMHLVLSNDLVISPGMSIPLRDGFDEQFDYEAVVQLNYLR